MAVAIDLATQDVYPPRVQISVTGLTVGDDVVLYRQVAGARTEVRGGNVVDIADTSLVRVDAELPYGVPVTYVAVVNGADEYNQSLSQQLVADDFDRTVVDGWGTATSGQAWVPGGGGVPTNFDVGSGVGTHTITSVNVARRALIAVTNPDQDVVVTIATNALATGGSMYAGPIARVVDGDNMYMGRLEFSTGGGVVLEIRKRVAGTETQLATVTTGLTHVAATGYRVRLRVIGSKLAARVWLAADPEPGAWAVQATDTSLTAAGSVGVRSILSPSNTNVSPVISHDTFVATGGVPTTATHTLTGGKVALSDAITGLSAEVIIMAWPERTYPRRVSVFQVGGFNRVIAGPLGQPTSTVELFTETTSQRDNLAALLAAATEAVIQIRQPGGYDGVDCYAAVLDPTERRFSQDGTDQRRLWSLPLAEVPGWSPSLEARGYTLADLADAYDGLTLDDLSGDYATLLDIAQGDYS